MRDDTLRDRFRELRASGDRSLRNQLIEEHRWIAVRCARRFAQRGEPLDDLVQVAQIGVLKAVERFDPELGLAFVTFAMPTVLGELRRHFRDRTWALRVPRRAKELHLEVKAATDDLHGSLGRPPRIEEIAEHCRISVDDVLTALEAGAAYRTGELAPPSEDDDDTNRGEDGVTLGQLDIELLRSDDVVAVEELLAALPEREQTILRLRFFEERTQQEIASAVGLSQVHVSRLLRASLVKLRERAAGLVDVNG